ncbi:MAG: hypothetical protein Q9M14_03365 [Mariprofundaceae bacterium]|nr:hypothetical protein [Mariprofundaceae bacterium]
MNDVPSLSALLIQGKDDRLKLDEHGYNSYGCQAKPKPNLLRFGSSTASNISSEQWIYAQRLHANMLQDAKKTCLANVQQAHTQIILKKLRQTCHLAKDTDIQLADSGTAAHQLAMQQFCRKKPHAAWHIIMVDALETGRGVPKALCLSDHKITAENIAIRQISGEPLPPHQIQKAFELAIQRALQKDLQVVLLMVDVSKTGYIAPSLATVLELRQKYPQHIHILLDACQFRFSIETLNDYLQHDIVIAITGSKFLAAPSFCAALLIPHQTQQVQEPQALGVLLRWHLALNTLQTLNTLSTDSSATLMQTLASNIQSLLQQDKRLTALPTPSIQRPQHDQIHWQNLPTIFPFFIKTDQGFLSHQQALSIFQKLQCDKKQPIQLGRPMPFVINLEHEPVGVFRLCISAPMMIDMVEKEAYQDIIEHVVYIIQKLNEMLVQTLTESRGE